MTLRLPVEVTWCVPAEIIAANVNGVNPWTYVRIYRSMSESSGYELVQDTVLVPGTTSTPFVLNAESSQIYFNKTNLTTADVLTFLDAFALTAGQTHTLLTLGETSPTKLDFHIIKDDVDEYRFAANNHVILHTETVNATRNVIWDHSETFNVGDHVLDTTELPVTYLDTTSSINTIASNNTSYTPIDPYTRIDNISEISAKYGTLWVNKWTDPTIDITQKDGYYYIVKYVTSDKNYESKFYLPIKSLTPKEARLVRFLRAWISPWMSNCMSDDDLRAGFLFAIQSLNVISPVTGFNIQTLPERLESVALVGAAIYACMYKYLGIAFTDVSYSDNGVSITIDRGGKVQNSIDKMNEYYAKLIYEAKMYYITAGTAIGSVPLTMSLGGRMSGNILNFFNVLNAIGR